MKETASEASAQASELIISQRESMKETASEASAGTSERIDDFVQGMYAGKTKYLMTLRSELLINLMSGLDMMRFHFEDFFFKLRNAK